MLARPQSQVVKIPKISNLHPLRNFSTIRLPTKLLVTVHRLRESPKSNLIAFQKQQKGSRLWQASLRRVSLGLRQWPGISASVRHDPSYVVTLVNSIICTDNGIFHSNQQSRVHAKYYHGAKFDENRTRSLSRSR
jgi:hypothetical protein